MRERISAATCAWSLCVTSSYSSSSAVMIRTRPPQEGSLSNAMVGAEPRLQGWKASRSVHHIFTLTPFFVAGFQIMARAAFSAASSNP